MPRPDSRAHCARVLGTPWPGVHVTDIESARHYGRHWHATFGVGVMEAGAQRSASGRGTVDAFAGQLLTHNPGEVHDGQPLGAPTRCWRMLHLEPQALQALADGTPAGCGDLALSRPVIDDRTLRSILRLLMARLQAWQAAPGQAAALACEEALVQAGTHLLARHASRALPVAPAAAPLARVFDRLADAALPAPSLAELAALAGVGRFQLLRRFRQACGLTPHAWLLQLRAERARQGIARGLPLAGAAHEAGFADQSHMTRVFARQFGYTPGAWRQAAAALQ